MIGIGSAPAFMIPLKIIADNFFAGSRGALMGATLTIGTIGALSASHFVSLLLDHYEWRDIWSILSIIGFPLLIIIYFAIPKSQANKMTMNYANTPKTSVWLEVRHILKDRNILLYAFLAIGLYSPLAALADLWGAAFLSVKLGLDQASAAKAIMILYFGLAFGSIFIPWFFEKNNRLNLGIKWSALLIVIILSIVIYFPINTVLTLVTCLFVIGLLCGAEILCFTGALRYANSKNSGEIIGIVNTLNMLGSALLQQLIGYLLDLNWGGAVSDNGLRMYDITHYYIALLPLITVVVISWLMTYALDKHRA